MASTMPLACQCKRKRMSYGMAKSWRVMHFKCSGIDFTSVLYRWAPWFVLVVHGACFANKRNAIKIGYQKSPFRSARAVSTGLVQLLNLQVSKGPLGPHCCPPKEGILGVLHGAWNAQFCASIKNSS